MNPTPTQDEDATVLKPDAMVFEGKSSIDSSMLNPEANHTFPLFERVTYPPTGGIYIYFKGMPFPKKGFPYPEAALNNDVIKKFTMTFVKIFANKALMIPIAAFALLPWKTKIGALEKALADYARTINWLAMGNILKRERYSTPCREIWAFVETLLTELGFSPALSFDIARIMATVIEYDDAYRYRFEDLMTEINKDALVAKPRQEIKRIMDIFNVRELAPNAKIVFSAIGKLLGILILHPKFKRAFVKACAGADFSRMSLDNADRYHVLLMGDYDYTGRTSAQRMDIYKAFHRISICCKNRVTNKYARRSDAPECLSHGQSDDPADFADSCGNADCLNKSLEIVGSICKGCGKDCEIDYDFPPFVKLSDNQNQ